MSNAHKGSRLITKDSVYAIPYESTHFDFNRDATGIYQGEIVYPSDGGVYTIRKDGKFGGSIAIEEGTTNKIATEGLAAQDWTAWSHYTSSSYWNQSNRGQIDDPVMGKVFYGATATSLLGAAFLYDYSPYSFVSGSTYTVSIYLKASKDLPTNVIEPYFNTPTPSQHDIMTTGRKQIVGITTEWKRYVATYVVGETTSTGGLGISLGVIPNGVTLYAAMPQIEQKAYATSFVNGTRAAGKLTYPSEAIQKSSGTISCWLMINNIDGLWKRIVSFVTASAINGATDLNLDISTTGQVRLKATTSNSITTTTTLPVGQWCHVVGSWGSNGLRVYINGKLEVSSNYTGGIQEVHPTIIGVGERQDTTINPLNGLMSDLRIDKYQATDEEVMAWYIANCPFFNPYDKRAYA